MAATIRVFLDANIIFSAALGGAAFHLLWQLAEDGTVELVTSNYCRVEVMENLRRKRPDRLTDLAARMESVALVPDPAGPPGEFEDLLPDKDGPVLRAALAAGADVLLTGDRRHFGVLMSRTDLPLRVLTVRSFLLEGPHEESV